MESPDVFLDVPGLEIEELELEVEDLHTRISVLAELPNMVKLNIGVEADLDSVKLGIKGLQAQAQLTVRLDNIRAILEGVLQAADSNPEILRGLTRAATADVNPPNEVEEIVAEGPAAQAAGQVTEAARKKAAELGVDLAGMRGTGSGGRVTVRDVEVAAREG
jgi:pyruvate/2-oxoglutarate dehydrogenase complex dihydrolipoamide acyltransferase (E2) component